MSRKFRIGLDMDGVITNLLPEFVIRLERDFGITEPIEAWKSHRIIQQFPQVERPWVDEQLSDPAFWLNCPCIEDAWFMVNKWFMSGHEVFIITCRGEHNGPLTREVTQRWLDEWEIAYSDLITDEHHKEKYKTALKLECDLMVEDDPYEAEILSGHLPTYIRDYPYNRDYDIGTAVRISTLYDLDEMIMGKDEKGLES